MIDFISRVAANLGRKLTGDHLMVHPKVYVAYLYIKDEKLGGEEIIDLTYLDMDEMEQVVDYIEAIYEKKLLEEGYMEVEDFDHDA